jgi:hypothetical protein
MNFSIPGKTFKLLLIAASLLGSSIYTFGQTNIAIAPNKMNVLYIGVDNPLSVAASNGSDDKVTVTVTGGGGTVSKLGSGLYNVQVTDLTDECLVNVYVDGKIAGSSPFRVRSLPAPFATVGGYLSGSKIKDDAFRFQPGLGVFLKDFPFEVRYEVTGFTFTVGDDLGNVRTADCASALFTPRAKQLIDQYAKPGEMVTIDKIRVKDPSGKELKIPSLVYYIQ